MKPNNIMVQPGPNVKIIDLGQSCPVNTVKKRIQGTPDYIAPEQAQLKAITPLTDIFNFGATMYWILTGKTIPTMMNQGEGGLTDKKDPDFLPKPKPVAEIDTRIHPRLSELVMQCIENEPDNRPASMKEVRDRLELCLGLIRAKREAKENAKSPADSQVLLDAQGSRAGTQEEASRDQARDQARDPNRDQARQPR
jgi:serine/threonine-protein kinase